VDEAHRQIAKLAELGIDFNTITQQLQDDYALCAMPHALCAISGWQSQHCNPINKQPQQERERWQPRMN
jgi:hypothetical protein